LQAISAKAERPAATELRPIPPSQPDKKVPLDKVEALQRLEEAIQKVKGAGETVIIWAGILDQWHERLRVEWNKSGETPEPVGLPYVI
jgi:hypothetical protein